MLHSLDLTRSFQVDNGHSCIASEANDKTIEGAATFTRDKVAHQNSLAALPLVTYQAGETVIASGSNTGRLLILGSGTVAILKDNMEIARVAEPGAIFGELSLLLDQPHTADVRALETSQLYVANGTLLLSEYPNAVRHVATVLAHRLEGANRALIQLRSQLQAGEPHSVVAKTVSKMEGLLAVSGASLLYAGYPFDPFV
jgi:CRP/FNR family transcriptional regulator, cyclic AMP receptor protein